MCQEVCGCGRAFCSLENNLFLFSCHVACLRLFPLHRGACGLSTVTITLAAQVMKFAWYIYWVRNKTGAGPRPCPATVSVAVLNVPTSNPPVPFLLRAFLWFFALLVSSTFKRRCACPLCPLLGLSFLAFPSILHLCL